jgi:soluble cytochrome b562
MDILDAVMKWVVAPVAAFVWLLHNRTNSHATDIAVLKATTTANKEAHDREFKEMRENFKAVIAKLDSIEQALRK